VRRAVKVIIDTNVVVSGVFFDRVPGRMRSASSAGQFVLVLSPAILEEYRRVGHELGVRQRARVRSQK
jgi:predicted nucleic acid-binding protein